MPEKPALEKLRKQIQALTEENNALKRQSAKLQQNIKKWEAFAENLHEVFYNLDLSGTVTWISSNLEDFLGFKPEEMMGLKYTAFVHPEDRPVRDQQFGKVLEGTEVVSEARYVKKDGTYAWTRTQGRPILEDGRVVGIRGVLADITERKEAEKALRESEERFALAMEASKDGLWDWNLESGKVYFSPGYTRMLGYEDMGGEHPYDFWLTLVHPGDRDSALQANMDCIENRCDQFAVEFRMKARTGEWRWILGQGKAVSRNEQGRAVRMIGTHSDITKRKKAEESLKQSEAKYRHLFYDAQVPLFCTHLDGSLVEINERYARLAGYDSIEACKADFRPGDAWVNTEARKAMIERLEQEGSVNDYEAEIRRKDGSRIWISFSATIYPERGYIEGSIEDITSRRQAEQALRDSEREKNLILNSAAEMIAYYDTDLKIIWANRAAAESVHLNSTDLMGRRCYEIWQAHNEPCPGCPVLKAKETCQPEQAEMQTPDGRYWSVRGYPVVNDEGLVVALVEFGQDITDRKQAEEENARLQEQFHQAQKMESIGRLAGGVAHDLNNLLSPILGYGEMLLEDAPGEDPSKAPVKEIVSAAKRAQTLVRQLLAFSRKQPLQFQLLDINELLENFRNLLRRTLREDIRIEMHPAESLPQIKGDFGQIEQVIMNAAVNSQDAMPQGGSLVIQTSLAELDEDAVQKMNLPPEPPPPAHYVKITVSDSGQGMDKETLDNLFEPFFTTKETGRGTGLGMSTAYGIVKQHGGHIRASSEPGLGTTMKIYLPASAEPPDTQALSLQKDRTHRGSESILIAEDDQQVRNMASTALSRHGYQVLAAADGREALSLMKTHPGSIDLLLTDVIMPDINGKELFDRISAVHPDIRVLYMSGYTNDVIADHGVIDEGVHFLEKPFHIKTLAAKVRAVLDQ